jgi:hypothetical protein
MTKKEFVNRKRALLTSNNIIKREFGRAYDEIERLYKDGSHEWLSEDVDLSDYAHIYYKNELLALQKDGDKKHETHMAAASELFVSQPPQRIVTDYLRKIGVKSMSEAKSVLKRHPLWNTIHPNQVREAIGATIPDGNS